MPSTSYIIPEVTSAALRLQNLGFMTRDFRLKLLDDSRPKARSCTLDLSPVRTESQKVSHEPHRHDEFLVEGLGD